MHEKKIFYTFRFCRTCFDAGVADVLFDEMRQPSGLVLINRMSRKILLGKVLIDSTQGSYVGKLAGVKYSSAQRGDHHKFHFVTIGNTQPNKTSKVLCSLPYQENQETKVLEHSFDITVNDWSFSGLCDIENKIRHEVWDPDQLDSADNLFFIPPDKISGNEYRSKSNFQLHDLSPGMF